MSLTVLLAVVAAAHIVPILSGALLAVGARKGKKLLLIPWLVINLGIWVTVRCLEFMAHFQG